jgi:hypothetical protein
MARVAAAPLSATATSPHEIAGVPFTVTVANFTDVDPLAAPGDFSATIDWEDGTSSTGTIVPAHGGGPGFSVVGTHTYAQPGQDSAVVHILDKDGEDATATTAIDVRKLGTPGGPPLPPPNGGSTTPPGGGGTMPGQAGGPSLVKVRRFGVHWQPTRLKLAFSQPLDQARATDRANYRIVVPMRDPRPGQHDPRAVALARVVYDPATMTVTLAPRERLNLHHPFRLTVRGTGPHGITDTAGVALRSSLGSGLPGDETTVVTWKDLVLPDRSGRSVASLGTLRRLVWPRFPSRRPGR